MDAASAVESGAAESCDLTRIRLAQNQAVFRPSQHLAVVASQRRSPRESLESRVVTIRRNPLTAGFDGQGRKPSVLHDVARGLAILAQGLEYGPVALTGHNYRSVGLSQDDATKLEGVVQGTWTRKDAPMGADADQAGEYLRRDAIGRRTVDDRFQPRLVAPMILSI